MSSKALCMVAAPCWLRRLKFCGLRILQLWFAISRPQACEGIGRWWMTIQAIPNLSRNMLKR